MAMDFHAMHSFPGMAGCSNEMFIDGDDKELDDEDPLGQFETRGGDKIPTTCEMSLIFRSFRHFSVRLCSLK